MPNAFACVTAVVLAVSGTAIPSAAWAGGAATIHVSPRGSDSASGTKRSPLRTPQAAVDRLGRSGGTVQLASGRYPRQRIVISGRSHITVRAEAGAVPVLDGTGLAVPAGQSGMVEVRNGSDIAVSGLTITGYRTTTLDTVPIGIFVTGAGHSIRLSGNHVHHLGNDNGTLGSFDINAHGIAVYGTDAARPISGLRVAGNELDHLK